MAYSLDHLRQDLSNPHALRGYEPFKSESSNYGIAHSAVEMYSLLLQNRASFPHVDFAYVRGQLTKYVLALLNLTPLFERARVLREVSDQCGIDLVNDEAFEKARAKAQLSL
jgi:hypothetical protein